MTDHADANGPIGMTLTRDLRRQPSDRPLAIGVLGGMGPAATIDLMHHVLLNSATASEQDGVRLVVDSDPGVPDRNAAILRGGPSPIDALVRMARGLEAGGADFLVMACNTAHAFQFDIERAVAIPFVSMIEETCTAAAAQASGPGARVGVLAGAGCLAANLYQDELARCGLVCLTPDAERQAEFMDLLYAIKAGDRSAEVSRRMTAIAETLRADGAEMILAACTEVPLVLTGEMIGLPLINSTQALAIAAVRYARRETPLPPAFSSTEVGRA